MRTSDTLVMAASFILLPIAPFPTLSGQTPSPVKYEVTGIVIDEGKTPVAGAQLALMRQGSQESVVRSGADGRFSFSNVRPGQIVLTARRMGYKATLINVDMSAAGVAKPVEVELDEIASEIDSVIVEASKGHLQEFYEHKANNNFAKFFERKDIEKRNPVYLSELLRSVAGAALYASDRSGNRIFLRDCKPMVWVDGMRAPGAELDDVARPIDVAGLEVYPSYAGLPPQYQDRNNRMCGAIVVWTRNQ